jgi:hypothetical protein
MNDPSDYNVCDEHEAVYLKGGYCLECRIVELEEDLCIEESVSELRGKHRDKLEAQLKAVRDEISDCRDSWAPDQPPSDVAQFLIDLESVLEQEAGA